MCSLLLSLMLSHTRWWWWWGWWGWWWWWWGWWGGDEDSELKVVLRNTLWHRWDLNSRPCLEFVLGPLLCLANTLPLTFYPQSSNKAFFFNRNQSKPISVQLRTDLLERPHGQSIWGDRPPGGHREAQLRCSYQIMRETLIVSAWTVAHFSHVRVPQVRPAEDPPNDAIGSSESWERLVL